MIREIVTVEPLNGQFPRTRRGVVQSELGWALWWSAKGHTWETLEDRSEPTVAEGLLWFATWSEVLQVVSRMTTQNGPVLLEALQEVAV